MRLVVCLGQISAGMGEPNGDFLKSVSPVVPEWEMQGIMEGTRTAGKVEDAALLQGDS